MRKLTALVCLTLIATACTKPPEDEAEGPDATSSDDGGGDELAADSGTEAETDAGTDAAADGSDEATDAQADGPEEAAEAGDDAADAGSDAADAAGEDAGAPDAIYVTTTGSDANDGLTPATAVHTINVGLDLARKVGAPSVYVEQGTYTEGDGLLPQSVSSAGVTITHEVELLGGWDSTFTTVSGTSTLDGAGAAAPYHLMWIYGTNGTVVEGFTVKNGAATAAAFPHNVGGGVVVQNAVGLSLDVIAESNTAAYGAGVYLYGGSNDTVKGDLGANTATNNGGGAFFEATSNTTIAADVHDNSAVHGGGVEIWGGSGNAAQGTVHDNTADTTPNSNGGVGGGVYVYNSSGTTVGAQVHDNKAAFGAGVGALECAGLVIDAILTLNTASQSGGGVYAGTSDALQVLGEIASNSAPYGGGAYVNGGTGASIGAAVHDNTASINGGGVGLFQATNASVSGLIQKNTAASYGGGVASWSSPGTTITGAQVLDNVAPSGGSGLLAYDSPQFGVKDSVLGQPAITTGTGGLLSVVQVTATTVGAATGMYIADTVIGGGGNPAGGGVPTLIAETPTTGGGTDVTGQSFTNDKLQVSPSENAYANADGTVAHDATNLEQVSGASDTSGTTAEAPPAQPDTTPPVVAITSPANGATLNDGNVTISGTVTDDMAVHKVGVAIDNYSYSPAVVTGGTWSYVAQLGPNDHQIRALATDDQGNTSSIIEIGVKVQQPLVPPTFAFTAPTNMQHFKLSAGQTNLDTLVVQGSAAVGDQSHSLSQFYLGLDKTAPPFQPLQLIFGTSDNVNVKLGNIGIGIHTLSAQVEDNYAGNLSAVQTVTFVVDPPAVPDMTCTFGVSGQQFGVVDSMQSAAYSGYLQVQGRLNDNVWASVNVEWPQVAMGTIPVGFGTSYDASLYVNTAGTPPGTPANWNADAYQAATCTGTITITNVQQQAVSGTLDITFCDKYTSSSDHVSCTFTNIPRG